MNNHQSCSQLHTSKDHGYRQRRGSLTYFSPKNNNSYRLQAEKGFTSYFTPSMSIRANKRNKGNIWSWSNYIPTARRQFKMYFCTTFLQHPWIEREFNQQDVTWISLVLAGLLFLTFVNHQYILSVSTLRHPLVLSVSTFTASTTRCTLCVGVMCVCFIYRVCYVLKRRL